MVSFLMAHGHPEARHYPVPMLMQEVRIVQRRMNAEMASAAALQRLAVASLLSKQASEEFSKRIKQLSGS